MSPLLSGLLLVGCTKKPPVGIDASLPEETTAVEALPAKQVLEQAADDVDPSLRGRALGALVTAGDPEEWGPRGLFDPDGWVQRQTVNALVTRGHLEPLPAFVERDAGDPYVRAQASLALDHSPIVAVFEAETDLYRAAPLAFAALATGHQPALEPLVHSVSRGELALEEGFVEALGDCRTQATMPEGACDAILDALQQGEAWVEEELALAYAAARLELGDRSGEQVLRKHLGGSLQEQVASLDHLARLESDEAVALLRKASNSSEALVAGYAAVILASRDESKIMPFQVAIESPISELRALGATYVGVRLASGEKKSARALEQLLLNAARDRSTEVRQAAVQAWADAGLDEGVLREALTDESPVIRVIAAGALFTR